MRATVQPGYAPRIDRSRRQLSGLLTVALACLGLALAAPAAIANQPPTAQSGAAPVSGPAAATLTGGVDPNGATRGTSSPTASTATTPTRRWHAPAAAATRWRSARPSPD